MTNEGAPEKAATPSVDAAVENAWKDSGVAAEAAEAIREANKLSADILAMPNRHTAERFADGEKWVAEGGENVDDIDTNFGLTVDEAAGKWQ